MRGKIDLDYDVSPDPSERHRALYLYWPTIEMTGDYTCKISTIQNEVSQTKKLTVYGKKLNIVKDTGRLKKLLFSKSFILYQNTDLKKLTLFIVLNSLKSSKNQSHLSFYICCFVYIYNVCILFH